MFKPSLFKDIDTLLEEARRNPDLNPKEDFFEKFLEYAKDKNIFVTFADLPMLTSYPGNPDVSNRFLGVYAYPLNEYYNDIENFPKDSGDVIFNVFPFGGHRRYVHIIKLNTDKVLRIRYNDIPSEYGAEKFKEDISKLKNYFYTAEKNFSHDYMEGMDTREEHNFENFRKNIKKDLNDFQIRSDNSLSMILFNMMDKLSDILYNFKLEQDKNIKRQKFYLPDMSRVMPQRHKIMNLLGYEVIIDYGTGSIHDAERTQAVFLKNYSYKSVDVYDRLIGKSRNTEILDRNRNKIALNVYLGALDKDTRKLYSEFLKTGVWNNKHVAWPDKIPWEGGKWKSGIWPLDAYDEENFYKWRGGQIYSNKYKTYVYSVLNPNKFYEIEKESTNLEELKERAKNKMEYE